MEAIIAAYNKAILDTDRDRALQVMHEAEASGITPEDIVFKVVLPAMDLMVKSISENFDANLGQHFLTAQIADIVTAEMVAKFKKAPQVKGLVIIGISAMMVHTARGENGCLRVRQLLEERGAAGRVRVIVGGAPFRFAPELHKAIRADAWAPDPVAAARMIEDMVTEVRP